MSEPLKTPSIEFAYTVWREEGHPSLRVLSDVLKARGYRVYFSTLARWVKKHDRWQMEMDQLGQPEAPTADSVNKVLGLLEAAEREAQVIKPEHIIGIKAHLICRLYQCVRMMPFRDIEEWTKGLDAIDRLDAQAHAIRGKLLNPGDAKPSEGVLTRLSQPSVSIAPFKPKANGNGKGAH
jgi:hypothetical protein